MNARGHSAAVAVHAMAGAQAMRRPGSERVGLRCIRIYQPQLRSTLVAGSFFMVDKQLLEWTVRLQGLLECEFQIFYNDGRTVSGTYRFVRRGTRRPALMLHVRAALDGTRDEAQCAMPGAGGGSFLEYYDTEDFPGS